MALRGWLDLPGSVADLAAFSAPCAGGDASSIAARRSGHAALVTGDRRELLSGTKRGVG